MFSLGLQGLPQPLFPKDVYRHTLRFTLRWKMVHVHSIKDLAGGEDSWDQRAQDMDVPDSAHEIPVDGEKMSAWFEGVYHEKQVGALCAVHAMNNLVQCRLFDEVQLASIAHELDAAESSWLEGSRLVGEEGSANVRADGFFSVQVIVTALQRVGLSCAPAGVAGAIAEPDREVGFILNRREHWFALRRIGIEWFDLNSMFAQPRHMSPTHLALFLREHADQGYSIFVCRGRYPPVALENDRHALARAVAACSRSEPLVVGDNTKEPPKFAAFSGSGQRLSEPDTIQVDPSLQAAAQEDPELAVAIAASIAAARPRDAKEDADEIRRKRLARFGG